MKKAIQALKALLFASALILLTANACKKPAPPQPVPGPDETEINANNVAPGGFSDEGAGSWDE